MEVKHIKIKGVLVPLCIRCGEPVEKKEDVREGDKPTARIVCKKCCGE